MIGRRLLIGTFTLAASLFLVAGVAVAASSASVSIRGSNGSYSYAPRTQYIRVGGTVTWRNTSDAPHTVTSTGRGSLDSGIINPGGTFRARFSSVGTFGYICQVHGNHTGRVVVLAASAVPPDTDTGAPQGPGGGSDSALLGAAVGVLALLGGLAFARRATTSS